MQKRPLVCLVVALFEFCRFLALAITLVLAFSFSPAEGALSFNETLFQSGNIPLPLFLAPLALFPIMTFFLWFDPKGSRAYFRLYCAGKTLSMAAAVIWCSRYLSLRDFFIFLRLADFWQCWLFLLAPAVIIGDIVLLIAAGISFSKDSRKDKEA